jgi:hypothetical protein
MARHRQRDLVEGPHTEIQMVPETIAKQIVFPEAGCGAVSVSQPVNISRDIYLPICCDGKQQVLAMEESDQLLMQKEKELFWILYTQAVKEKRVIRFIFWIFFYTAVALVAFNIVRKVYQWYKYPKAAFRESRFLGVGPGRRV